MRADFGDTSVLTKLGDPRAYILDHLRKEVRVLEPPPMPQAPLPSWNPSSLPAWQPPADAATVEELGRKMIDGIEAEGKRYRIALPNPPQLPDAPQTPQPAAMITEVWTAVQSQLPVLTRITGPFGEQLCRCRIVESMEPDPKLFQIPSDYTQVPEIPPPPKMAAPLTR